MKPLYLLRVAGTLLLVAGTLAACHGRPGHDDTSPNRYSLSLYSIYDADSVFLAMSAGDAKAADKMLAAATEKMKKDKDTAGSVGLIKNALLLNPTAKGYFELSTALLSTHQYDEAIEALYMAEKLGYTPLANVMFRYCYAWARKDDLNIVYANGDSALRYMELALQMGYPHPQEFLRRDIFGQLPDFKFFDDRFKAALGGMAGRDPETDLIESYTMQFPEISLPLTLDTPWIKTHPLGDRVSYEFERFIPEMRAARFSRSGGEEFYFVALIKKSPAYFAVLYASEYEDDGGGDSDGDDDPSNDSTTASNSSRDTIIADNSRSDAATTTSAYNKELAAVFYLVTYDRQGKIIDKMLVAGRDEPSRPFKIFAIQTNMHFELRNIWDEKLRDQPANFLVDAAGKFVKTDAPLAAR